MFILVFLILSVNAYLPNAGPVSLSQGGAGRAAFDSVESMYLNPAGVSLNDSYFLAGSYLSGEISPGNTGSEYGFVAADGSKSNLFPAAFGYRYAKTKIHDQEVKTHLLKIAAAQVFRKFSLGLSAQRRSLESIGLSFNEEEYQMDLGALFSVNEKLILGLTVNNLLSQNMRVPSELKSLKYIGLGGYFVGVTNFSLRGDLLFPTELNPEKRFIHQIGIDSKFYDEFHFRAGYELDDYYGQNSYSLGIGWEGPRLKLAYAFQQTVRKGSLNRHMIDLWLNF